MKVKIKSNKKSSFVPYTVTFIIDTEEDSEWFHDNVAIRIGGSDCGKRTFVNDVFKRGVDGFSGNTELEI